MYQIWRIYLDLWGHDWKKWVWPTFGCKLGQSDPIVMQLELDMSCHLLNVYTKFQIDISKHVEEKSGKRGRTDGQTDGRTLPRHNTSRFSNGRIIMTMIINKQKVELKKKRNGDMGRVSTCQKIAKQVNDCCQTGTRRNNNVIVTSKRRYFCVVCLLGSYLPERRYDNELNFLSAVLRIFNRTKESMG